ncbi:hypothetical protein MmiEs2_10570 [Methanimicrococcus stummii]|uniref:Imm-5-like domain-containing protein n=1 Tax=Methanimicrococcus stummii TaxID=3028294 RepID=A0AA96ZXE1_9EURY|nr:hypothetical protein [Methanimicrococcus sp. Es2]WNY28849.1 hypothetical protein MmiEs2_10570 [Methanimicrococcus sp. Es2]
MDWIEEVKEKISRKNQILFAKDSEYLQELTQLIEKQNRRAVVLWAFEFAEDAVQKLSERYPNENRPSLSLTHSKEWAAGRIKMPEAKQAILGVHAFAKEIESPEDIALCHAVGQACGTVHTKRHAPGFPIYELTALVRHYGIDDCKEPVEKRMAQYIDRILYWEENEPEYDGLWAGFMLKENSK